MDSDHLCYIYLESFTSPADLSTESGYLVSLVLPFKLLQKTCTKDLLDSTGFEPMPVEWEE